MLENNSMFNFPQSILKRISLVSLAVFFVVAGIGHFVISDFYLSIMPSYLPYHLELVYLSGIFEILGGLGVLISGTRKWAGYGLMVLLIAVYPANIHMAIVPEKFAELGPPLLLYARLPLQFVFIAWAYWSTKPDASIAV